MPLDPQRLQKVKPLADGGFIAQCPVCAQDGGDHAGQHLRQFPDGRYACAAHPGDREHRRHMNALAGDKSASSGQPKAKSVVLFRRFNREDRLLRNFLAGWPDVLRSTWSPEEIRAASPSRIPPSPSGQVRVLLRMFNPRDLVWMGDHRDSGEPRHARHFRTACDWMSLPHLPPGPRICPAAFKPGTFSRCQEAVKARRFLVVESDTLPFPEQGAVLRWVGRHCRLRAVVDTRGRSLHGWFDVPTPTLMRDLRLCLDALPKIVDPALWNAAQPCRLPGWPRDDNQQLPQLIYLAR